MLKKCKQCGSLIPGNICVNPKCGVLQPKIGPKTFDEFMAAVNREIAAIMGSEAADLPDYDYTAAWEGNKSPRNTARAAIKAAGGDNIPF